MGRSRLPFRAPARSQALEKGVGEPPARFSLIPASANADEDYIFVILGFEWRSHGSREIHQLH